MAIKPLDMLADFAERQKSLVRCVCWYGLLSLAAQPILSYLSEIFIFPSSVLAGLFFSVRPVWNDDLLCWDIVTGRFLTHVTNACSGITFFLILISWMLGRREMAELKRWRVLFIITGASILLTIVGNSSRIICAALLRPLIDQWLGHSWRSIIHECIGSLVFLSVILVTSMGEYRIRRFYDAKLGRA